MSKTLNRQEEETKQLASFIWDTVIGIRNKFFISEAILSVVDSKLILNFPKDTNLNTITFSYNGNTEDIFSAFSSIAGKSSIEGKVICNSENVKLFFR